MKTLPIRPQPRLGAARTVGITLSGIRYRLFRSLVTVVVVSVAMAFMMNVLSEAVLRQNIVFLTRNRIAKMRIVGEWMGRLSTPSTAESIVLSMADETASAQLLQQYGRMGALPDDSLDLLTRAAREAAPYLEFFSNLDYGTRRILVGNVTGARVFDRLGDENEMERFRTALADLKSVRFVSSFDAFGDFVERWPYTRAQLERIRAGWAQAVGMVHRELGDRSLLEGLSTVDRAFGGVIREAGFALSMDEAEQLAVQARFALSRHRIESTLNNAEVKRFVALRLDVLPNEVTVQDFWTSVGQGVGPARAFLQKARAAALDLGEADADWVVRIAALYKETGLLSRAERAGADIGTGLLGLGDRTVWLLLISVVVCAVGIANVMLMAVAERFREIATLKCLGALDGFIMLTFVLEACLLGVVGGAIGAVLGAVIGFGRVLVAFGPLAAEGFPGGQVALAMIASVALGMLLAAIASVYPSYRAARMPPMEAMRIE